MLPVIWLLLPFLPIIICGAPAERNVIAKSRESTQLSTSGKQSALPGYMATTFAWRMKTLATEKECIIQNTDREILRRQNVALSPPNMPTWKRQNLHKNAEEQKRTEGRKRAPVKRLSKEEEKELMELIRRAYMPPVWERLLPKRNVLKWAFLKYLAMAGTLLTNQPTNLCPHINYTETQVVPYQYKVPKHNPLFWAWRAKRSIGGGIGDKATEKSVQFAARCAAKFVDKKGHLTEELDVNSGSLESEYSQQSEEEEDAKIQ